MLTSDRKFGLEIEFLVNNARVIDRLLHEDFNIVQDGSLRPHTGGEYVSRPLTGNAGVVEVERVCQALKRHGANVEHPATSMHVHLDGKRHDFTVETSNKPFDKPGRQFAVSRMLMKGKKEEEFASNIVNYKRPVLDSNVKEFDGIRFYSKARLTRRPKINYTYFLLEEPDRIPWLTRMFYFYTQYDAVMANIVSHSRSMGNMYCQRLGDSFTLEEIESIKSESDFVRVWYKGNGIGGHYCNSRYHNVNFHSYFDRHGTVEIRSHGATTDPNKVLLWVKLHQYIADKLEKCTLDDIKIDIPTDIVGLPPGQAPDNVYIEFIKFLEDEPVLVEYVKRMLGYFSGITITKDKVIRK